MKRKEFLAIEHAKRYTSAWDYFIVSSAGYMKGFEDALAIVKDESYRKALDMEMDVLGVGDEEVLGDLPKDGSHQLSIRTFEKWKNERT